MSLKKIFVKDNENENQFIATKVTLGLPDFENESSTIL